MLTHCEIKNKEGCVWLVKEVLEGVVGLRQEMGEKRCGAMILYNLGHKNAVA